MKKHVTLACIKIWGHLHIIPAGAFMKFHAKYIGNKIEPLPFCSSAAFTLLLGSVVCLLDFLSIHPEEHL